MKMNTAIQDYVSGSGNLATPTCHLGRLSVVTATENTTTMDENTCNNIKTSAIPITIHPLVRQMLCDSLFGVVKQDLAQHFARRLLFLRGHATHSRLASGANQ